MLSGRRAHDGAIGIGQDVRIVVKARRERTPPFYPRRNALGDGQAFRMLFKTLDTEQFGANRRTGDNGR